MPSMVTGIIAAGRNLTVDYNAGQACDIVIKVFTCIKTVETESETCLQRCLRPLQLYEDHALPIQKSKAIIAMNYDLQGVPK